MIEITIIVPVYNVEKYLKQCLDSIYQLDLSNKEVILVNDGSTDNSLEILKKYKEKYSKNTILISQENKGLSSARNTGILNSNGNYLLFIDSDDFVNSESLEKFLKEGLYYNLDILMSDFFYYFSNKIVKNSYQNRKNSVERSGLYFLETGMKNRIFNVAVCKNLYKKDFLIKNNLFFKSGILHEDNLFTPIAFTLAKKVKYSQNDFYYYRQTNNNSITKSKNEKKYKDLLIIIEKLLEFSERNNLNNRYFNRIIVGMYLIVVKDGKIKNNKIHNKIKKLKLNFREKLKLILIKILS